MRYAMSLLLDQPLLQFLLLGAILFGANHYLLTNDEDPRRILIDDARYAEIAGIFQDNQGRAPSAVEMEALMVTWAQNEVLYREARLMELDKGDEMIRQRLILKLRNVFFNRVVPEAPDQGTLEAWFEANRGRYDKPAAFDFEQFLVGNETDDTSEAEARTLAASLGRAAPGPEWSGRLRRYFRRPLDNLAGVFGSEHAEQLVQADGRWVAVASPAGWHAARITGRHAAQPARLDDMRTRVVEDYKADKVQEQLVEGMQAIARRYDIRIQLRTPPEAWDAEHIEDMRLAMERVR